MGATTGPPQTPATGLAGVEPYMALKMKMPKESFDLKSKRALRYL